MIKITLLCLVTLSVTMGHSSSFAQTQSAADRAGEIKLWREQCNDPDVDLRTAYIEQAIETMGAAVKRICIRQALESTDADIRNLALRAALANIQLLTFKVEKPPRLEELLKKNVNDDKMLNKINSYRVTKNYRFMRNNLTVNITEAQVGKSQSVWQPLGSLAQADTRYVGTATVVGDEINWSGSMYLAGSHSCRMALGLNNGAVLQGHLQCADDWSYPITAKLL